MGTRLDRRVARLEAAQPVPGPPDDPALDAVSKAVLSQAKALFGSEWPECLGAMRPRFEAQALTQEDTDFLRSVADAADVPMDHPAVVLMVYTFARLFAEI